MNEHLKATLGLDTRDFAVGLRGAKNMATEFQKSVGGSSLFKKAMGAFAGVAVFDSIKRSVEAIREYADEYSNLSKRVGASTDFVQTFVQNVALSGGSAEDGKKALSDLSKKLGEAGDESSAAAKDFAKYGIEVQNSDKSLKSLEEVTMLVSDRIKNASSASERNAIAMKLMGESGQKALNALSSGSSSLKSEMALLSKSLPTEDELNAVRELGDELGAIKNTILGFGVKALAALFGGPIQSLPDVKAVRTELEKMRDIGMKFVGDKPEEIPEKAKKAIERLNDALEKQRLDQLSGMQKVAAYREIEARFNEELKAAGDDLEKQAEIKLKILQNEQNIQKELLDYDKKRGEQFKKNNEIEASRQKLITDYMSAKGQRTKYETLGDLAALDPRQAKTKELQMDILRARQAQSFQEKGKAALAGGNQTLADQYFTAADKNISKITNLKQTEDIANMLKQLLELNASVQNGIIVIPKNGP